MKRIACIALLVITLAAQCFAVGPTIPPNPWDDTSCPGGETGCNPW